MIKALAACATALALAACAAPVERTSSGEIPQSRIYIKSMTQQDAGLSQVEFSRAAGMLNNEMLELAINDVVLAQMASGEHLAIWLKPGRYDFSARPVLTLNTPASAKQDRVSVEVKAGGAYKIHIATEVRGLKMSLAGQ
ncbi:NAD-GH domain containing protein [Herbaspirillum robiniae]|uniref:NAD-GH domain containing protein n=1 Tax=Herbaspirillum robiniae TaxID=2014887 RepID=A0A246WSY4_9BURK|nr:NAD-GH domain containing protein [Herbaspirillum robiniae]NUU03646.1 NAD-GH domain containing protein [Herbaspirillum robiniae]OWY30122.1 NAD-GH domain containing protein [Herbaspirillum robiniae]